MLHARRSVHEVPGILIAVLGLIGAAPARAQGKPSHYDGLQLAPTVHAAVTIHDVRGGVGAEVSVSRWFYVEAWGSRISRPLVDGDFPGAWSTGVAINSRVAGPTHAFIYGLGLTYTTSFQCPQRCSLMSSIELEEHRVVEDMLAMQPRLGYEARFRQGWFVRGLVTFDLPFWAGGIWGGTDGPERYPGEQTPITYMHVSTAVNIGYAFRLRK